MRNKQSSVTRKQAPSSQLTKGQQIDFWEPKTLEQLTAEQGIRPIKHLEEVFGQGATLWRDEVEWEAYLEALRESQQGGE